METFDDETEQFDDYFSSDILARLRNGRSFDITKNCNECWFSRGLRNERIKKSRTACSVIRLGLEYSYSVYGGIKIYRGHLSFKS